MKLYRCPICGNIVWLMKGNVNLVRCCGRELEEIACNTVDASLEKHVPIYNIINDKIEVLVGDVMHPMESEHYIMWIAKVTDTSVNMKKLYPNSEPKLEFEYIKDSKIYSYCNLHGLWMSEVK